MQKSKKKKFNETSSLAVFQFPVTKRAEKVCGFVFSAIGEERCGIKLEKKKIFFSPFRSFFTIFGR